MGMNFEVNVDIKTTGKEQIDALERQLNALKNEPIKINVDIDSKNLNAKNFNTKSFNKKIQDSVNKSVKSVKFKSSDNFYDQYFKEAKKSKKETEKVGKDFAKSIEETSTADIDRAALKAAKAKIAYDKKIEQVREKEAVKQAEQSAKIIEKARDKVLNGAYDAKSSTMFNRLDAYNGQDNVLTNAARKEAESYNNTLSKLKDHFNSNNSFSLNDEEIVSSFNNMTSAAERFDNAMTQIRNTSSKTLAAGVAERSANEVKKYYEDNSKAIKKYGTELKDLENRYRQSTTVAEKADIDNKFKNLKSSISAEGLTGKSLKEELARGFKQIGQFAVTYGAIQKLENLIVNSVGELKEIDSVLTEISKTSDLTDKQIKQLGKDSFESASKYGRTAKDYLIGVQEMSRSGFYGKQGEELAELSILGQAAGDMTSDVSNSYLLATNAAYNYAGSVEKLNTVLDGQNMITNRNSVNMTDMAEATSKAASMASQTGVKINELSAVIGTAVARTKQEGNVIGTSLKSLFVNLQDTSNKKIVGTFEELGISQVKYVNGSKQLKTPIELLKELSVAYNNLPEGSTLKADVLRNIGQKRQANVLAAILGGMSSGDYDKMLTDYTQGKGSAAMEAAKSADNWEGNLNKLSNAWTSFINNFTDTDLIIGATQSLTSFVGVLDTLTSSPLLTAGTIGSGLGIVELFKNLDEPKKHRVSA